MKGMNRTDLCLPGRAEAPPGAILKGAKDAHPDGRRTRHDQEHRKALASARSRGLSDIEDEAATA